VVDIDKPIYNDILIMYNLIIVFGSLDSLIVSSCPHIGIQMGSYFFHTIFVAIWVLLQVASLTVIMLMNLKIGALYLVADYRCGRWPNKGNGQRFRGV
jgi:hypothetical protein